MNHQYQLKKKFSHFTNLLSTLIILLLFIACENRSEYERTVSRELSSSERVDSLFLGYYFGMSTTDFFDLSRQLNSEGVITGQTTIHYSHDKLGHTVTKYFYPSFEEDKIFRLPIEASYDGWAPWNRTFFSDSLMVDLMDMYTQQYGAEFFKSEIPDKDDLVWVSVNSNQRIVLNEKDDMIVQIEFLDLSVHNP